MRVRTKGASTGEATEVVVPVDPTNEAIVLAAALVSEGTCAKLLGLIPRPSTFQAGEHRAIWSGLRELAARKLRFDLATLQQIGVEEQHVRYAGQLIEMRPDVPPNLEHHVEALFWDERRSKATTGPVAALLDSLKNPREDPARVAQLANAVAEFFRGGVGGAPFLEDSDELANRQATEIERRCLGQAVYPFGIHGLDNFIDDTLDVPKRRLIPGAAPSMVTIVTALSGAGKSLLIAHMVLGLARQERRVLFAPWEPGTGMSLELLALLSLGYSRTEFMSGLATAEQREIHRERMRAIGEYVKFFPNPFWRETNDKPSNARNLDLIQQHIVASGCDVFAADLFERCMVDDSPSEEKRALFRIQAMTDKLGIHSILAAQQRGKDVEMRPDKRPTREGVKGSGAWTEIADNMIGVHRPALWKSVPDNTLETIVLKQRYGVWPLAVEFDFDPTLGSIAGGRPVKYDMLAGDADEGTDFLSSKARPGKKRRGD